MRHNAARAPIAFGVSRFASGTTRLEVPVELTLIHDGVMGPAHPLHNWTQVLTAEVRVLPPGESSLKVITGDEVDEQVWQALVIGPVTMSVFKIGAKPSVTIGIDRPPTAMVVWIYAINDEGEEDLLGSVRARAGETVEPSAHSGVGFFTPFAADAASVRFRVAFDRRGALASTDIFEVWGGELTFEAPVEHVDRWD